MTDSKESIRLPFIIETIALFIIPFEELLALSFGSVLRIVNLLNLAVIIMLEKRIKLDWNKKSPIGPMVIFLAYAALSGIWCFNRGLYLDRLVTYGMYIVLILLLRTLNPNEWEKKSMLRGLFFGGLLATIMLLYNTGISLDIGGGRETIAFAGRRVDANILSVSMVISFVIALYHLLYDKQSALIRRILYVLVMAILFSGILTAGSRGAMVSMVVTSGVMVFGLEFKKNTFLKRLIVVIIACLAILTIYYRVISTTQLGTRFTIDNLVGVGPLGTANRERIWTVAFQKILQNPIIGYGNGSSPYVIATAYRYYGTHNSYIMVLLEFGLIGFTIAFTWMKNLYTKCKYASDKVYRYLLISLFVIVIFVEGFSTKIFWGIMLLLTVCCASEGVTGPLIEDE